MAIAFFCEKCGMIKAPCVCNTIDNKGYINTKISKPKVSELEKVISGCG